MNNMNTYNELALYEKYILVFDLQEYFFNDKIIKKMNTFLKKKNIDFLYDYPHIGGDLDPFANVIIITLPILIQSLSFDALYDVLRHLTLLIFKKITSKKIKRRKMKEKPTIYFEYRDECIQMDFDFNLTKKQKDKIIDTLCESVQEMIKRENYH